MGIFSRKTNAVKKLSEIEKNSYTPKDIFNLENNIIAQEAAIDAQVGITDILSDVNWNRWIHINLICDYFANRFKYECVDYKHNFTINRALRNGFIYGKIGVWNNNGTPEIVSIIRNKNTIEVIVITDDSKEFKNIEGAHKQFKVKEEEIIEYQFNSLGYSAFLTFAPFLKWENLTQKVLYNETLTNATRILRDVDANSSTKSAKQFINFKSPIINRFKGGSDKYEGLTLNTNTEKALETIEYTKNWYYDIYGRRTNTDYKKTHSLNSEIEAGQFNCDVLERDRYMFLKKFLREYAKLFNTTIYLENLNGKMEDVFEKLDIEKMNEEISMFEGKQNE